MTSEIEKIKNLRDRTGLSFSEIKKALEEGGGDPAKALEVLKTYGVSIAQKKSSRATKEGIIEAYIHMNKKVGSLVELHCETDFVARNIEFVKLAHEIAMQITSMDPQNTEGLLNQLYIKDQDITINDLIQQYIAKLGENIKVGAFSRFQI